MFFSPGAGKFEPREIKIGLDTGEGWMQVLSGLKGGEEVVTSAQFLLDSESRFREAIANMLKPAAPAPGGAPAPAPMAPAGQSPGMEHMQHKH